MNFPQGGNGWQHMPPHNMAPQVYPGQPYPQAYAPGYYAPSPPPKKSKAWLWVLLAILTVIVLGVGGYVGFVGFRSPASPAQDSPAEHDQMTLTLEVTGTGTAGVWYTPDLTVRPVDLPWTEEVTIPKSDSFALNVNPVNRDATVTCKVSIDGKVVAVDTWSPTDSGLLLVCKAELGNH